MKKIKTIYWLKLVSFVLIIQGNAIAQSNGVKLPTQDKYTAGTFAFIVDQDWLYFTPKSKNEDRNYTQGTAFVYSNVSLLKSPFFWPLKKIQDCIRNNYDNDKGAFETVNSSVAVGGTAFTPIKLDSINPIVGDRPFSFLFYVSTSSTFRTQKSFFRKGKPKSADIYHSFRINYGLFGSRLGYEFQSFAHKYIVPGRTTNPQGWNTQISNGGQPTLLLEYNRFRPLFSIPSVKSSKSDFENERTYLDLGWNFGGSVGYYERIFNDLYLRAGILKRHNQAKWNGNFSSIENASYEKIKPSGSKRRYKNNFEIFGFARLKSTLMFRNSMLVGQRWQRNSDEYTMNPEWVKTALFDFEWGLVASFHYLHKGEPRTYALFARQVMRTAEFDSKIFPKRQHYFGSAGILIPVR